VSVTLFVTTFVFNHVCLQHCRKTTKHIATELSESMGDDSGIMPLNSPGGSTVQWGARDDTCRAWHSDILVIKIILVLVLVSFQSNHFYFI